LEEARGILRTARTSKLISALAILGLIVFSGIIVLVINASYLAGPALPFQSSPNPGPTGTLNVQLHSNQNESDRFSNPAAYPLFPVGDKAMNVTQTTNSTSSSGQFALSSQTLVTDPNGIASQQLSPGRYVVSLKDQTLEIIIPVQISAGNNTDLSVTIHGAAYPLVYSESGVPATTGTQTNMFVELSSSTPVANVSEPVILKVNGTVPGTGYLVDATVVSHQPPTQGTQWLELGAAETVDPVNATSIVLTTWTYSSSVTVQQGGPGIPLDF
jgi:hypothetical protein